MRVGRWVASLGLGCALLAGCAEQHSGVSPDSGLTLMQTGVPILSCRDACLTDWRREQPQAQRLYAGGGQWRDLATLLIRVGYQDDLSLYYLGRAAEGLGFPAGAAAYYRQSTTLSGTSIACANLSRQCGGLVLPQAAALRLSSVTLQLERSRRVAPAPPQVKASPAASEGVATGASPDEAAPPAPAPVPAPSPSPVANPADTKDYIEPPPAQR